MISINSKLTKIRDILNKACNHVYHYDALDKVEDYIVWAESGSGDNAYFDNKMEEYALTGTIDFFTKTEYNPIIDKIEEELTSNQISFFLNSVQYEEETKLIHYEWRFEI